MCCTSIWWHGDSGSEGVEGWGVEEKTVAQPLTENVEDGGLHLAVAVHLEKRRMKS